VARPRMNLGEWGSVALTAQIRRDGRYVKAPDGARNVDRWRARAKVRDTDGVVRDAERYGPTKAAARRTLEAALRERVTPAAADADIKPDTMIKDAAEVWRREMSNSHLAAGTLRSYFSCLDNHVIGDETAPSALAHLTVREVKVSALDRHLRSVSREHGPGAAKMTRSVLRGVLDLAVRHDAIALNPVRSVGTITSPDDVKPTVRDRRRAFTREERDAVLAFADSDAKAVRRDLGDLFAFLAGTGARIGEACAVRWSALDLDAGSVQLGPIVERIKGQGVTIKEVGKTKHSTRTVRLPAWLVARLLKRQVEAPANPWDVVFTSAHGQLRDPSNTTHDVRELMDESGHAWATAHTFRKTAATWLDEAGVSGREAANQLGHAKPSMTQDHYMSRRTVTEQAAVVL
jgi:integrase